MITDIIKEGLEWFVKVDNKLIRQTEIKTSLILNKLNIGVWKK